MNTAGFLERVSWKTLRRWGVRTWVAACVIAALIGTGAAMGTGRLPFPEYTGLAQMVYWLHEDGSVDWMLHSKATNRFPVPVREVSVFSSTPNPPDQQVSWWDGQGRPLEWDVRPVPGGYRTVAQLNPPVFEGGTVETTVVCRTSGPGDVGHEVREIRNNPGLGRFNTVTFVFPPKAEIVSVEPKPQKQYNHYDYNRGEAYPVLEFRNLTQTFVVQWRMTETPSQPSDS